MSGVEMSPTPFNLIAIVYIVHCTMYIINMQNDKIDICSWANIYSVTVIYYSEIHTIGLRPGSIDNVSDYSS